MPPDAVVLLFVGRLQPLKAPDVLLRAAARLLEQDTGLREVLAGDLELRADRDAHRTYLHIVFSWAGGDLAATMPGGPETGADFLARYDRAVEAALDGADSVVCFSHGAAIRTWAVARGTNVDAEFGAEHGLPNTGVVILDREGAGPWHVDAWTDRRFPAPDDDPTGSAVP